MKDLIITANYSFWKHPLKWLMERKQRKLMERMINFAWENGMKEDTEKHIHDMMFKGYKEEDL